IKAEKSKAYSAEVKAAQAIAGSVARARDLVNEPAGYMHPSRMASVAQSIAKKNTQLTVKVLGRKECEKLGMGMYLAVARGAHEEPKFIHMTYKPKKAGKKTKKVVLVGKGVMFDSGGYSIKPSAAMLDMKIDMAGSAAVISAMEAIAKLGIHHEVHAIAACCENMVSGNAYKLGDVLEAMDGTTVEINNTDAEGRLTLGDAITYARKKIKPDEIFDFATLTGACMVALGPYTAGVMSKSDDLAQRWLDAADRAGELMWRLPLQDKLKPQLKSNIADMKNTGERWGGAITAGLFLSHFAKDSTWLHVDLAGPASASAPQASVAKGGTGFAVATIVDYLRS
ncbi:MAG: leucyl aminopeptidase, partial [Deltaproteobacteria bacterium]|nr:leucyl aminopeptidase [Deltaproteobacteria bacterium]